MIFEVTPQQIEELTDVDLRTLIGHLAEAELSEAGLPISGVNYGGNQDAKDGGIDVFIEHAGGGDIDFLPRTRTAFQAKASKMSPADIRREMCPNGKLRSTIEDLGVSGGAYIIASSKEHVTQSMLSKRRNAMASAVATQPSASGLHVDFYDPQRLATWTNQHPGVAVWVQRQIGVGHTSWKPYGDWSSSPLSLDETYLMDEKLKLVESSRKTEGGHSVVQGIERIREILSRRGGAVRLVGLSGLGKTRLAQSLFDERVGSNALCPQLAVYTDLAASPSPPPLELLDRMNQHNKRCVLIVDNCGADLHRKLVASMSTANSPVSLITVEYDISDDEPERTSTFELESSSDELVVEIVRRHYPALAKPEIDTIARFSDGNARIALALANTAGGGVSLANLKDKDLFRRLFWQNESFDDSLMRAAETISLIYSFDGETLEGEEAEMPVLAKIAGQSIHEIYRHVSALQRRKLVQSRSKWRALLPHALAQKLAHEALQDIPFSTIMACFPDSAPMRLVKSFSRRIGYLHDSEEATRIVEAWLGSEGWLHSLSDRDRFRIDVLVNIAPVAPELVLRFLESTLKLNTDMLRPEASSKSTILRLLRSIAYDSALFERAIDLISRYPKCAENVSDSDEAVRVFNSLFHATLSGTTATPTQRADVLRKFARSDNSVENALFIEGLGAMLECEHFSSDYGFDFGTRRRDFGYRPRSMEEYREWYETPLSLAAQYATSAKVGTRIRTLFATRFPHLAVETLLVDQLIELARVFASKDGWPQGWVGVRGAIRRLTEKGHNQVAARLKSLEAQLKPKSLLEKLVCYVIPEQWSMLDVAELDPDDSDKAWKAREQAERVCREVGQELAGNLDELRAHLPVLMESDSQNTRVEIVAAEIGRRSSESFDVWKLIKSEMLTIDYEGRLPVFPPAFVRGVAETCRGEADVILDDVEGTDDLRPHIVLMQVYTGIDERGVNRLIAALRDENVETGSFRNLGALGACDSLNDRLLYDLYFAVCERDGGAVVAIEALHKMLHPCRMKEREPSVGERVVGRALLSRLTFLEERSVQDYILRQVVEFCLGPEDESNGRHLCEKLMKAITHYRVYECNYIETITTLARLYPITFLETFVEGVGETEVDAGDLFSTLRENRKCPIGEIDEEIVFGWASKNPASRFTQLARCMRLWEPGKSVWSPRALRLMQDAPDPITILSEFAARLRPRRWSGSLADVLESRIVLLDTFLHDSDPKIAGWARDTKIQMDEKIKKARTHDADLQREYHERFEW